MDATIANAYSLDRVDYDHILGSFSHKSFGLAPEFCIAAFDELAGAGLDKFSRSYDPYVDIPLGTAPAQPITPSVGSHWARRKGLGIT